MTPARGRAVRWILLATALAIAAWAIAQLARHPGDPPPVGTALTSVSAAPVGTALASASAATATTSEPHPGRCPAGHRSAPERAARIRRLLESTRRGRDLLARHPPPTQLCFAAIEQPAITSDDMVLLDERPGDPEIAARLGHLLLHAVEGPPLPERVDPAQSCDDLVHQALMAEAQAHSLELELRRALQVTTPLRAYPFEADYWAAAAPDRIALIRRFFEEHPDGVTDLPGFVRAYTKRCEQAQAHAH